MLKIFTNRIILFLIFYVNSGCGLQQHLHIRLNSDIRYYSPKDDIDEYLANLSVNIPDYYIFDKICEKKTKSGIEITYKSGKDVISIITTDNLIVLNIVKKQFNLDLLFGEIDLLNVYKLKLGEEEKFVLSWFKGGTIGNTTNNVNFTVIDTEECSIKNLNSYNGRISCFNDLNGDGQLDYIKISEREYYQNTYTYLNVYELSFIDLSGNIEIENPVLVLDCSDHFIEITKEEVKNLSANPCDN